MSHFAYKRSRSAGRFKADRAKIKDAMIKHFRVPGRLALRLEELGVSLPGVLRRSGLPRDLFAQTRVLVSTAEVSLSGVPSKMSAPTRSLD